VQRSEGKQHRNGEICELAVPNSEHKGSGHHPERCHQWVALLIVLWCLGVVTSALHVPVYYLISPYLTLSHRNLETEGMCSNRNNGE
jgi:hypothetical protein